MFEDIYKKTSPTNSSPMSFSTDFTEELWEKMKKDPKKLGNTIRFIVNGISGAMSKDHKMVFTGFQFHDVRKRLRFDFKIYDLSDKEERKIYLDSLDPEERKWYEL